MKIVKLSIILLFHTVLLCSCSKSKETFSKELEYIFYKCDNNINYAVDEDGNVFFSGFLSEEEKDFDYAYIKQYDEFGHLLESYEFEEDMISINNLLVKEGIIVEII